MQFTICNNGTQCTLDIGPDSVVLSVKDLDENLPISLLEIRLAAWSLLLSQRQEFFDNHLPRVPITPNQQGTFEMRKEVLSSVGAQDTDTRGYELSNLEDNEFSCEDPVVGMESVYWPGIATPISPTSFDAFRMASTATDPIVVDTEEGKKNSAPTTTTAESERPTEPPRLLRSCLFWIRLENVPDSVYRTLFRYNFVCVCIWYSVCVLYIQVIWTIFHWYETFFKKLFGNVWDQNSRSVRLLNLTCNG